MQGIVEGIKNLQWSGWDGLGTYFALYSSLGIRIELVYQIFFGGGFFFKVFFFWRACVLA